jgi:hypothetical protein
MPLIVLGVGWALLGGRLGRGSWSIVVGLQALLLAGGVVALRSGELEEGRVARIVGEAILARHEAAAGQFLWAAVGTLALGLAVFLVSEGRRLRWALALAAACSILVCGLAVRVGHAGGRLVYVHGAADAYVGTLAPAADRPAAPALAGGEDEANKAGR